MKKPKEFFTKKQAEEKFEEVEEDVKNFHSHNIKALKKNFIRDRRKIKAVLKGTKF